MTGRPNRAGTAALLGVLPFLLGFTGAAAPVERVPDSPAQRRFAALMAALDAGEPVGLREWIRATLKPEMLRTTPNDPGIEGFLLDQQRDFGSFEVHRLLASGETQVEVLVRARRGTQRRLR